MVGTELIVPLASRSQVVKILDPHLLDHILRTTKGRQYDHAEWLVSILAGAMPEGSAIELVADSPTARTADDEGNLVPFTDEIATKRIDAAVQGACSRLSIGVGRGRSESVPRWSGDTKIRTRTDTFPLVSASHSK